MILSVKRSDSKPKNRFYALTLILIFMLFANCENSSTMTSTKSTLKTDLEAYLNSTENVLIGKAENFLKQPPEPLTNFRSTRSEGGIHDFYSEGDYWWKDENNPDGPYIRKDGLSNPNNFLEHRKAMRNLNEWVSTLVAAYEKTGEVKYAQHAIEHLNAFFLNPATLMNPNLLYAQAIKGRHTGRGIGIIDTIHLIEVARSILKLSNKGMLEEEEYLGLKKWFKDYSTWMNTHKYGLDEKDHGNNHSTWWAAQIAAFAQLTEDEELMEVARSQFKKLLSKQMSVDGTFPEELARTKPYIYSLFNLEGYSLLCHIASTSEDNLWEYEGETGSIKKAWDYMVPYIKDKSSWPKPPDVSHFDELPIQSTGLLMASLAYDEKDYFAIWKTLSPLKLSEEIKRNFPLWHPENWI